VAFPELETVVLAPKLLSGLWPSLPTAAGLPGRITEAVHGQCKVRDGVLDHESPIR
jgi:hypothetical protein